MKTLSVSLPDHLVFTIKMLLLTSMGWLLAFHGFAHSPIVLFTIAPGLDFHPAPVGIVLALSMAVTFLLRKTQMGIFAFALSSLFIGVYIRFIYPIYDGVDVIIGAFIASIALVFLSECLRAIYHDPTKAGEGSYKLRERCCFWFLLATVALFVVVNETGASLVVHYGATISVLIGFFLITLTEPVKESLTVVGGALVNVFLSFFVYVTLFVIVFSVGPVI